jgi:hypothetical protein
MYFGKYYVSASSKRKVPIRSVRKRYSGGLLEVQVQFPTATVKKTSRVHFLNICSLNQEADVPFVRI